ncbi:MAG: hypothetical protein AAGE52_11140 [Myxococcota bacterium]
MLPSLLARVDAPEAMIAWAKGVGDDAWATCPSPEWQVWLAGVYGESLNHLLLGLSGWAGEILANVPDAEAVVLHVLAKAEGCVRRDVRREDCLAAAEEADRVARDAPATFRNGVATAYPPLATGAAWVARAAEGLLTARLRAEADRMQRAQATASYLGAGVNALVENEPLVRLAADRVPEDAFHAELLYVVAAGAEAASALALALQRVRDPSQPPPTEASEETLQEAAAQLRAALTEVE